MNPATVAPQQHLSNSLCYSHPLYSYLLELEASGLLPWPLVQINSRKEMERKMQSCYRDILAALLFFLASPFYIKLLSSSSTEMLYHHKNGSTLVFPSEKMRFLNKACIIHDPEQDLTPDGRAKNPWNLCTVDQVEDLKALLKFYSSKKLLMEAEEMDINPEEESLLGHSPPRRTKGGLKTMPFIIVNEAFERLASQGLMPNMILYLTRIYHFQTVTASSILFVWSALSNGLALFGAFLSHSYLGRFRIIFLGSFSSLLGMILLWLTAVVPQLQPLSCDQLKHKCSAPNGAQIIPLLSSFFLMSVGAGCIRPCSVAFGADQFDNKQNPNNDRVLESYFNWYYASTGISTVLAMTVIVYIQDHLGWSVGFGIPAILMVFSALMFLIGSSLYIKAKPSESLFTGFFQVLVAAFRKREIQYPLDEEYKCYHRTRQSKLLSPTEEFRCLNKACVVQDPDTELTSDGLASNPWRLCSVEQLESLKALLKVIPMWSTGLVLIVTIDQGFLTLQANSMDRHLFSNFEIPAGSFSLFMIITLTIWVAFYDRVLAPLLVRYTGNPQGLSPIVRMGMGLIMSFIAMVLAGVVESIRLKKAVEEGVEDDPDAVLDMSAMWLVPQTVCIGLAEALNAIGQIQFFYMLFPKSMSSVGVAMFTSEMALASLIGSLLVNIINSITSHGGKASWLASNLNEGHLDYYYWLLGFLNLINFFYFLFCCRFYKSHHNSNMLSKKVPEKESGYTPLPSA
ncbi:protein NRT1/ PTR FAMILY 1.2 isoform X7 [Coffea arabica]|uniref:Protein NRT1/ PTR FAMILY 1.2 isoform X7 n=1 Tax=Coffea arabica TaxID=13443 RepID=A0ABM4VDB1_COFAR